MGPRRRGTGSVLTLVALVFSSCGVSSTDRAEAPAEDRSYGGRFDLEGLDGEGPKPAGASRAPAADAGRAKPPAAAHPQGAPQAPARADGPSTLRKPQDFGPTGQNAVFYLRAQHPKLVIEINAVSGREPTRSALDLLRVRLESVVDKPRGIEILPVKTFAGNRSSYTTQEIKRLEEDHRSRFSSDDAVVIHLFFLNGSFAEGSSLGGVAYGASSAVLFVDQIKRASTPAVSRTDIEGAVLVHEAGHLLGLVNIGYRSGRDHEDPEHPRHSRHRSSVMFWAVESTSVATILSGGPPNDFHPDDRGDLEDRRAGRL